MNEEKSLTPIQEGKGAIVPSGSQLGPVDRHAEYIPRALEAIENKFSLVFSLVGIVGYIVIAAFGQITNFWRYIAYLSILIFGLLFYELKKAKLAFVTYLLLGIIVVLVGYIGAIRGLFSPLLTLIK